MKVAENAHNRHKGNWVHDENDWYVEESWCADELLDFFPFSGHIHDPACGMGTIVKACQAKGFHATGSDKIDRGYGTPVIDFIENPNGVGNPDYIITNPPFYRGVGTRKFMDNALMVAGKGVAILAPLPFLASQGRLRWFRSLPLTHVLILSRRPSMPPGVMLVDGTIEQKGGKEDYVWLFVQQGANNIRPVIEWVMPGAGPRIIKRRSA